MNLEIFNGYISRKPKGMLLKSNHMKLARIFITDIMYRPGRIILN